MGGSSRAVKSKAKAAAKAKSSNVRPAGTPSASAKTKTTAGSTFNAAVKSPVKSTAKSPALTNKAPNASDPSTGFADYNGARVKYVTKSKFTNNPDGTVTVTSEDVPYGTAPGFFDVPGNRRTGGSNKEASFVLNASPKAVQKAPRTESTNLKTNETKGKTNLEILRKSLGKEAPDRIFDLGDNLFAGIDRKDSGEVVKTKYNYDPLKKALFKTSEETRKAPELPKVETEEKAPELDLGENAKGYLDELNKLFAPIAESEKQQLADNNAFLKDSLKQINKAANAQLALLEEALGMAEERRTANIQGVRSKSAAEQMKLAAAERGRARGLKGRLANLGALGTTGSAELSVAVLGEQYDVASQEIDNQANDAVNDLNLKFEDFVQKINSDKLLSEVEKGKLLMAAQQQANQIKSTILQSQAARKSNLALSAFQMAKTDLDNFKLKKDEREKQEKEMLIKLIEKGADIPQETRDKVFGKDTTMADLADISRSANNRDAVAKGIGEVYDYLRTNFGVAGDPAKRKEMIDTITAEVNNGRMTVEEGMQLAWSTVSSNPTVKKRLDQIGEGADLDIAIKKKQLATMGRSGAGAKQNDPAAVLSFATQLHNGEITAAQVPAGYKDDVSVFMSGQGWKIPQDLQTNFYQGDLVNQFPPGFATYDPITKTTQFIPLNPAGTPPPAPAPVGGGGGTDGGFWDSFVKRFGG